LFQGTAFGRVQGFCAIHAQVMCQQSNRTLRLPAAKDRVEMHGAAVSRLHLAMQV
jgi:hypothetical protein